LSRVLHTALHFIIRLSLFLAGEYNFPIYFSLSFGREIYERELTALLESVRVILNFSEVMLQSTFLSAISFTYLFSAAKDDAFSKDPFIYSGDAVP